MCLTKRVAPSEGCRFNEIFDGPSDSVTHLSRYYTLILLSFLKCQTLQDEFVYKFLICIESILNKISKEQEI